MAAGNFGGAEMGKERVGWDGGHDRLEDLRSGQRRRWPHIPHTAGCRKRGFKPSSPVFESMVKSFEAIKAFEPYWKGINGGHQEPHHHHLSA